MKKIGLTIYALNVFHTGKYHVEKKHGHLTFIDMLSAFSKLYNRAVFPPPFWSSMKRRMRKLVLEKRK